MKKAKIFENFGLKILAVFISILLWLAVINVSDPVINTTYTEIPVIVTNTESVTTDGKVYELESESTVTISVSAKRSVQDYLSEDNFKAVVDLEDYDEATGQVPIRVESNKYNGQIESMKSKTEFAVVNIEEMLRKQFMIVPIVSGDPEEGYVVGEVSTAENIVRVSGAESVVSAIKKVTAEMSVSGLNSDVNTSVDLKLYDQDGRQIKDNNLTKNISTVAMSAQILATKELPLNFTVSGSPKDGYSISGDLTASADTVLVAGKQAVLAKMTSVDVSPAAVSVEGADKDVELNVDLTGYLPDGIVLVDPDNTKIVAVEVPIDAIVTKEIEIEKTSIQMVGLPGELEAEYIGNADTVAIEVEGVSEKIAAMKVADISLQINWDAYMQSQNSDGLTKGTYRVPVTIVLPEGVALKKEVSLSVRLNKID
ncbi:MAG: hypothetical protein IJZ76_11405 [Lachnospiraceae bacterium]|nr:hypothetical protein [Lachnospiraceae bacterium]